MQPIMLEEAPFGCFKILWNERGRTVSVTRLREHTGSQANLDKNISRLRERLEPFFKERHYLYLQRDMGRGIWIERYAEQPTPTPTQPPVA
jgi:hypothetical protein